METGMEAFTFFFGPESPFSNWHPATFTLPHPVTGRPQTYTSVEQRMMHSKALLFNDYDAAAAILRSTKPRYQKQVGRRVRNFDPDVWNRASGPIVEEALYAKFSQNLDLLEELLSAPGAFVEASPYDRIWGIGLAATDPRAQQRSRWRGENRLGRLLDQVRERLLMEEWRAACSAPDSALSAEMWDTFELAAQAIRGALPVELAEYVLAAI